MGFVADERASLVSAQQAALLGHTKIVVSRFRRRTGKSTVCLVLQGQFRGVHADTSLRVDFYDYEQSRSVIRGFVDVFYGHG